MHNPTFYERLNYTWHLLHWLQKAAVFGTQSTSFIYPSATATSAKNILNAVVKNKNTNNIIILIITWNIYYLET